MTIMYRNDKAAPQNWNICFWSNHFTKGDVATSKLSILLMMQILKFPKASEATFLWIKKKMKFQMGRHAPYVHLRFRLPGPET